MSLLRRRITREAASRRLPRFPRLRLLYLESRITPTGDIADTIAAAGPAITRSFVTTDSIGDGAFGAKDVDVFQLPSLSAGERLTAVTSRPPAAAASMDTYVRLFDGNGNQLTFNDDFSGLYSRVGFTVQTAGTYYLGISA